MKLNIQLGKFKFALGKQSVKSSAIGSSGTSVYNGFITEEYKTELQGQAGIKIYDQMRRSDCMIQAMLTALSLPLRSAEWFIAPPEEATPIEQEATDFINDALFNKMSITFDDFLNHVLLMNPFGFMIFEKVFKIEDGKIYWKKLAPRLPKTLHKWLLDEEGGLTGIQQYALKNNTYNYFTIPIKDLIVFTRNREGSNYEGMSVLRAPYKNWFFKDLLCKIAAQGLERQAIGIIIGKLAKGFTPTDKTAMEDLIENIRTNEESGGVLPPDYDVVITEGKIKSQELLEHINYHDTQMTKSILAQFLQLGTNSTGSYALSADQSGFFMMALNSMAKYISDTMNRYAIKELVDMNFSVNRYPKLKVKLDELDIDKIINGIDKLTTNQVIIPDEDLETFTRNLLSLPQAKVDTNKVSVTARKPRGMVKFKLSENGFRRDFTKWEKVVNFAELKDRFDNAAEDFIDSLNEIIVKQSANITTQITAIVESGKIGELEKITSGYKGKYSATIKRIIRDLAKFGNDSVLAEHKIATSNLPTALNSWLSAKGETLANLHCAKIESTSILTALNSINAGKSNKAIIYDVKNAISKWAEKELKATSSVTVGEAINEGRQAAAYSSGEFQAAQYSALLDDRTCPLCEQLDGKIITLDNPDYDEYTPPVHSNCRCIWVYIGKEETNLDITWQKPNNDITNKYGKLIASEKYCNH
uniref:Phage head morphogenesis domain-containing protein n=1 Tax=viral metagenome TaxID=1070528 RepID=A0A6M3IT13_9ZZZZ